jgi:uncharacterized protein DUF1508
VVEVKAGIYTRPDGPNSGGSYGGQVRTLKGQSRKASVSPEGRNGESIAASQGYETKASAEKGIESVKTNAPSAAVVDPTE